MAHISSIFNFLKDYNEISNPIITEIDKQKWSLKLSEIPNIEEIWSVYQQQDFDSQKLFEIQRPTLVPCPSPDDSIIKWLDDDWRKVSSNSVSYKEKVTKKLFDKNGSITEVEEYFVDDVNRISLYEKWILKREMWREKELPRQKGLDLYNNLFKLYSDIKKESESVELILGDGIIKWYIEFRNINHPILLQNVQLEFNPNKPSFIIKCDEMKPEIYTAMLRIILTANQSMLSEIITDVEDNPYHIADISNVKGLFQRLINVLDEKGKLIESEQDYATGPIIMNDPVLFLRKRTLGFSTFIERIIDDIKDKDDIRLPDFFQNMIGNHKERQVSKAFEENWNVSGIDEDVLLTLPANNEQMRIIKYLNKYGAVLVQGPPGTGKTHTIANMIGHLLSEGNSVLITSHTEKALTVLKEKVYKDKSGEINLQNLCISLLSTKSQKEEMDNAINEIAIKSSIDIIESSRKIERLENERKSLISKSKSKSQDLLQIRGLEYKDLVYDNKTIRPIEAAKFVNSGYGKYDYIPGPTIDDTIGMPLSSEDLSFLYHTNHHISPYEDDLLNKKLPDIEKLWEVEDFNSKAIRYFDCLNKLSEREPNIIINDSIHESDILIILAEAKEIVEFLQKAESYQISIIEKTIKDRIYNSFWSLIFVEIDELMLDYKKYREIQFNNGFIIPEAVFTEESIDIINDIIHSGKVIPINTITKIIKPKWKKLHSFIINEGKNIITNEDFEKAQFIIKYNLQKIKLYNKINKLLSEISETINFGIDDFEERINYFREKVSESLSWYENKWLKLEGSVVGICSNQRILNRVMELDFEFPIESMKLALEKIIIPDLEKGIIHVHKGELEKDWGYYEKTIKQYYSYGQPFSDMVDAVIKKDNKNYKVAYDEIVRICNKKEMHQKRCQLINKIKGYAPMWAEQISNRVGVHGEGKLPKEIELAWMWLQLNSQIKRIDNFDLNEIQKELRSINNALIDNARKLAYEKAWYNKIKNKTDRQTQAIEGWRQTIRQIGKGMGKAAPRLLKKARELMPLCQTAIPVWIMPLNRVVENFDPQNNKFDVVIIDEASQADILALSALYLGKRVIIVGDDEQVSPDNVGIKIEEINAMIEQHLKGIPNSHLFNGKTSVYDLAKASGFKPLMLTEHFRCLPEIIEFSNKLSYNGRIRPLRDTSNVRTKPYIVEYRVPNGYKTEQKTNKMEAEHIASLICACVEEEVYCNKTIGVISLLGHNQAYEIDKLLQINLDPNEYETRKIQCGSPAQFQGDERDIIFISIVEGPNEKGGPVRLLHEEGRNDANRKRYNVAASRAKDQMWIVHSLNPEIDLKPDDIRLKLIHHAINPNIDKNEELNKLSESPFEKEVMEFLLNKGYKIIPQWKVGSYRIDMVVESNGKRIALECDGEQHHTLDDLPNDLKRQAILERLGWRFIRIRGSEYYRNPEKTMERVYNELERFDIRPDYSVIGKEVEEGQNSKNNELIEKIKRRAETIRRSWHADELGNEDIQAVEVPDKTLTTNSVLDEDKKEKTVHEKIDNYEKDKIEPNKVKQLRQVKKIPVRKDRLDELKEDKIKFKKNVSSSNRPLFDFTKAKTDENSRNEKVINKNVLDEDKPKMQNENKKENISIRQPKFDFRRR